MCGEELLLLQQMKRMMVPPLLLLPLWQTKRMNVSVWRDGTMRIATCETPKWLQWHPKNIPRWDLPLRLTHR